MLGYEDPGVRPGVIRIPGRYEPDLHSPVTMSCVDNEALGHNRAQYQALVVEWVEGRTLTAPDLHDERRRSRPDSTHDAAQQSFRGRVLHSSSLSQRPAPGVQDPMRIERLLDRGSGPPFGDEAFIGINHQPVLGGAWRDGRSLGWPVNR